jgi:hypothetical protein
MLFLYIFETALLNATLSFLLSWNLFFSIFFVERYNGCDYHSYPLYIVLSFNHSFLSWRIFFCSLLHTIIYIDNNSDTDVRWIHTKNRILLEHKTIRRKLYKDEN